MQIVRGTEMRLRGGISMAEMQKRAAEIPLEGADDDEEQENGVGATFQLVGTGDNSVAVFNLCGERHEVPVANLDMPLLDGQATTALQLAAAEGAIAVVEGLLGLGASSSVGNEDGDTPAHIAAFRGHTKVLEVRPHAPPRPLHLCWCCSVLQEHLARIMALMVLMREPFSPLLGVCRRYMLLERDRSSTATSTGRHPSTRRRHLETTRSLLG